VVDVPAAVFPLLIRALGLGRPYASADAARAEVQELSLRPRRYGPPRRLVAPVTVTAERRDGWLEYRFTPASGPTSGSVVYAHGGGWVHAIQAPHWRRAAQIAVECRTIVVVPIYPLVPFGTALEALDGFTRSALEAEERYGPVRLVGDSAGGQIALALALHLRDAHALVVPMTVLDAPALDLSVTNPHIPSVPDPFLHVEGIRVFADAWRGDLPIDDPRVSPLFGELHGLGTICLLTGTRDILNPDAHLLARRAREAGTRLILHEEAGALHTYSFMPTAAGRRGRRAIMEALTLTPYPTVPAPAQTASGGPA
jgi:acetyl esterase/lipase